MRKDKTKDKRPLSKKQKGFVADFIRTGNATEAVKKNYKVSSDATARSIGSENLTKPNILKEIKSVAEHIPNSLLLEKHLKLLRAKEVQRFIFPTRLKDDEIIDMVADAGFRVITIRPSPLGKMAFYSNDNPRAIKDGLDMAYKLKGSYEPEEINMRFKGYTDKQLGEFIFSKLSKTK